MSMVAFSKHIWGRYGGVFSEALLIFIVVWFSASDIVPAFRHLSRTTLFSLALVGGVWIFASTLIAFFGRGHKVGARARAVVEYGGKALFALVRGRVIAPEVGYERTSVLLFFVKAFFLPIMVQFMFGNAHMLQIYTEKLFTNPVGTLTWFSTNLFPCILMFMIFIDVTYFVVGYAVESERIGNTVRSVEPTMLGWFVALMCYPPFNDFSAQLIGAYHSDTVSFAHPLLAFIGALVALMLFGVYVAATIALGMKCSNLTNRGTVARGPYAYVRHPAYASKVLAWWISIIPLTSIAAIVSMGLWTLVYALRAYTEEWHLQADPHYRAYMAKVPYRFLPGVW